MPRSDDRIRSSSSTTKTVVFTLFLPMPELASTELCADEPDTKLCSDLLGISHKSRILLIFYGKLEDKSTAVRWSIMHANEAMMIGYDRRDDRQTKSGATL